ncbi:hypothetical protein [Chitinophaga filiformis]|uniref:Uncharacterized protein n=1 Tax=Chitinophaga filiformis TaxID=104663 RepID=A0ABY4I4N8_CHIFI|nr:hypothetical protein [Chitinophaga filiformis]UPK69706.1 hypothetical protein MYF79_00195 [Chitinophaga filiformis]
MKKFESLATFLPLLAVLVYTTGFITLTSFLNSNGVSYIPALDGKVIQVGFLSFFLLAPIPIITFQKIDQLSQDDKPTIEKLITLGYESKVIIAIFSASCVQLLLESPWKYSFLSWLYPLILFGILKINKKGTYTLLTIIIFTTFFGMLFFVTFIPYNPVNTVFPPPSYLHLLLVHELIFFGCFIFLLFLSSDKVARVPQYISIGLCFVGGSILIGNLLLEKIKSEYAGTPPQKVTMYFKEDSYKEIKRTIISRDIVDSCVTINLIFENDNFYFFKKGDTTISLPKDLISVVFSTPMKADTIKNLPPM